MQARIARIEQGNLGDVKTVGSGVFEARIHCGPGLRGYFGIERSDVVVLVHGGNKNSQEQDIKRAKIYWSDYKKSAYGPTN